MWCITYHLSCAVSSYDLDSHTSLHSIRRLKHAGINIVTSLQDNLARLQEATFITLSRSDRKDRRGRQRSDAESVELLMERWEDGKGCVPLTWRSLLNVLQKMKLGELSQQMEDYLSGMY